MATDSRVPISEEGARRKRIAELQARGQKMRAEGDTTLEDVGEGFGDAWDYITGQSDYDYSVAGAATPQVGEVSEVQDFGQEVRDISDIPPDELDEWAPVHLGATPDQNSTLMYRISDGKPSPMSDPARLRESRDLTLDAGAKYDPVLGMVDEYGTPLLNQLQMAAAGMGPSQAQDTLREGTARNIKAGYGMAASAPVNASQSAALMASAMGNSQTAMQDSARQSAQLRAQEMTDARTQLGQTIGGIAGAKGSLIGGQAGTYGDVLGQDLSRASTNVNAATAIQQANLAARTTASQAQGAQEMENASRGSFGISNILDFSDIRGKDEIMPLAFESTLAPATTGDPFGRSRADVPVAPAAVAAPLAQPSFDSTLFNRPAGGGGGGGDDDEGLIESIFSDARSKDIIGRLATELADTKAALRTSAPLPTPRGPDLGRLDASAARLPDDTLGLAAMATPAGSRAAFAPVQPYSYRYKPEVAAAQGTDTAPRAGIMAQELARSPNPALRSAVVQEPRSGMLAIDGGRALSANLAATAGQDKRLRQLEALALGLDEADGAARRQRATLAAMPTATMPRTRYPEVY